MDLVAQMRELGFWPADDGDTRRSVEELARRFTEPRTLARELIERDLLTPYQANYLLTGKGKALQVGRYLILDRLGEGGMGKVYKARDRKMHRVVALKIIHPERVANKTSVQRFYREIQAVARLSHPNIVWAFDADKVGSFFYFAMQYVPGVDLAKLVKQAGPLEVARACDFIRQAALGLQHIADNGMVHRDIKPSNLLIIDLATLPSRSDSGIVATAVQTHLVKILDLGLTRLEEHGDDAPSALTQDNTYMGTPDYIAPEQARDSHTADIRSDIYSLGCTLYFALIGRPPFGGATAVQKIMRHQLDPPERLESLRADIPPALTAVVHRMLAKRPEERYQRPAEVAQVLEPFARGQVAPNAVPVRVTGPTPPQPEALKNTASMFQFGETETDSSVVVLSSKSNPGLNARSWEKWLWLWIAGGAAVILTILILILKLVLGRGG
jgi:serine/threonine-protein kinase